MNRRVRAASAAAALAIPAPLLTAGEPAWAVLILGALSFVCASVLLGKGSRDVSLIEADYVVGGAFVWTLCQLIPLPAGWAPDVVVRGRALAGLDGWAPLSIDPASTRER